jgi:formylglycine-generating enzyme required for sulfatase activity
MFKMKKIFTSVLLLLFAQLSRANNLAISTPVYSAETLTFTISWDNSWNISVGPSNHDAVWIFVKRQKCTGNNDWVHQLISTTASDHTAKTGTNPSTVVSVVPVSDGFGVFIKRIGTNVTGNVASQTITLKLGSTSPSIATTTTDNFKVLGIEMVYVPEGEFYIGDGRTTARNAAFCMGASTAPLKITSAIQGAGIGAASNYTMSNAYGCSVPLPSSFPLGYNGFYCMKYEILQGQFLEYLNSLTYDQQAARLKPTSATYLPNQTPPVTFYNWNSINMVTSTAGTYNSKPAVFSSIYPHLPMGGLNWQDLCSYLDWSGLRPMTEFEFEKACRGNNGGTANAPVAFEYAWGTTILTGGTNANYFNGNFTASATWGAYEGACRYWEDNGPIRAGFASSATSNRSQAGATYYGIMEMSGNVSEQCVGGGAGYDYSNFTNANGDGLLTTDGLANVTGWPVNGASPGSIIRGGNFRTFGDVYDLTVSDRMYYSGTNFNSYYSNYVTDLNGNTIRAREVGGRGVRTF